MKTLLCSRRKAKHMLSQIIPASPLGSLHEESSSAGEKGRKKIKLNIPFHCYSIKSVVWSGLENHTDRRVVTHFWVDLFVARPHISNPMPTVIPMTDHKANSWQHKEQEGLFAIRLLSISLLGRKEPFPPRQGPWRNNGCKSQSQRQCFDATK